MVDNHKSLIAALKSVLPVYYEMTLHSGIKTPCISYMEVNNYETIPVTVHSTIGASRVVYQIKVWATDIAEIQKYAAKVDKALRQIGYTRTASGELYDNNSSMIQKILTYEGLVEENY